MIRRIVKINEERCNGCGLCADACHEGAIGIVNGKAKLLRDDYCDGLGDCLPACPMDAISFEEREALPYDHEAVAATMTKKQKKSTPSAAPNCLNNWPVQIKLLPGNAGILENAEVLIAADCTAYAYGNFHNDFINGRVALIGCPKLDNYNYAEKLGIMFSSNNIRSVTLTRMFVPCCGGMESAVKTAIQMSGKNISLRIVTISADGKILKDEKF